MFTTIDEIKRANAEIGHHFFDPGTMRWFGSRVGKTVYGGKWFVTSEQYCDHRDGRCEPRKYTIRHAEPTGEVDTHGGLFQAFDSGRAAVAYIKRHLI